MTIERDDGMAQMVCDGLAGRACGKSGRIYDVADFDELIDDARLDGWHFGLMIETGSWRHRCPACRRSIS